MKTSPQPSKRRAALAALLLGFACLGGCSGSTLPSVADPAEARPILTKALDAWKQGEKVATLRSASPPISVIDHQWDTGWTLVSYEFKGEGIANGVQVQQAVALELKNPKGKTIKKTSNFLVNTGRDAVITREDLDGD